MCYCGCIYEDWTGGRCRKPRGLPCYLEIDDDEDYAEVLAEEEEAAAWERCERESD